jgi:hypothetical protein
VGSRELNLSVLGYGQVVGCCEQGNEISAAMKCREFINYLKIYDVLKEDSAPCSYLFIYLFI